MKYIKNRQIGFTLHLLWGNKKIKSKCAEKGAGFTLIELLVGVAIFALSIMVAVNLFMSVLKTQRKSFAIQNVQGNARYLISFMAKEIRMSEINTSDGEQTVLNITHPINGNVIYNFSGTQILRSNEPINSDEVQVSGKFFIDGKTAGRKPRVTIVMKVETTGAKAEQRAEINLQTTLNQRNW